MFITGPKEDPSMEKETSNDSKFRSRIVSATSLLPSAEMIAKAMRRATSRIPFVDDVLSMYYCAIDPKTPAKIRIVIAATLLYLVMPLDIIPDFLALIGYTDDATALMVLVKLVSSQVTHAHRQKAKVRLSSIRGETADTIAQAAAA
jgi:uncharacterized membrane protein YkvA (DUF1232 family)